MRGVIISLNYDGTRNRLEVNHSDVLKELQYIVGGLIEQVPGFDTYSEYKCIAFCHEEGKIRDLPLNFQATSHWYDSLKKKGLKTSDYLVGNIAVAYGDKEFMEAL